MLWPISQTINHVKTCAPHNLIQDSHESYMYIAMDVYFISNSSITFKYWTYSWLSLLMSFFRLLKFYTDHLLWSTTHSMNNRLCIVSFQGANLRTMRPFDPPGKKTWKKRKKICCPKKGSRRPKTATKDEVINITYVWFQHGLCHKQDATFQQ